VVKLTTGVICDDKGQGKHKLQGFMLPEHREMLQHLNEVEQHMVEKPILDEQKD
jgi:hypothetical protein